MPTSPADLNAAMGAIFQTPWLFLILVWTLFWKGLALWKAARNSHKRWFIVLLCVNTLAILEITYLFYFSKPKQNVQPVGGN